MDRRAKKLEKKRKDRERLKKKATALAAKQPSEAAMMVRLAAHKDFGPCYVSEGWNAHVSLPFHVVVTRRLPSGEFLPAVALVDRAGPGVKDGFLANLMLEDELEEFIDSVGIPHGGMSFCSPLEAQSLVFGAIDEARSLGFEPHPDFPLAMLGPRPAELLSLPESSLAAFQRASVVDDDARS